MTKTTAGIDPERLRLLADRLAYVNGGYAAVIKRHGMQRAKLVPRYYDAFDRYAAEHAAELLPVWEIPDIEVREIPAPGEWVQMTLL